MILNFGHTIGHALEKLSNYKILHGYAVALGMLSEAEISKNIGQLRESDHRRLRRLLVDKMGISLAPLLAYKNQKIINTISGDKKALNGKSRYVLLQRIGKVHTQKNAFAHTVPDKAVVDALRKLKLTDNI